MDTNSSYHFFFSDFIHGQNVDDTHMIRFLDNLLPKNVNDNDNSSHTTTRATRSFSICQPAFERSFITSKVKHFLSVPGLHAYCSSLHSLELKATTDLCVLIVDDADEVTGTLLSNWIEYVLKLLGKVLMSSRNVTLVMTSREPPPFGNFCPQRYKATRIGSPEDVPSHTDEVTGTFLPNVKEYVLKLLGNVLMPNRNVTLVMASREPPPFGNFCPQRYKATRIGSPEDVPSHTDEVTGTFLPNVKEYVLKLLGNVLLPNRNVTLVMTSREPPPFGNFCP